MDSFAIAAARELGLERRAQNAASPDEAVVTALENTISELEHFARFPDAQLTVAQMRFLQRLGDVASFYMQEFGRRSEKNSKRAAREDRSPFGNAVVLALSRASAERTPEFFQDLLRATIALEHRNASIVAHGRDSAGAIVPRECCIATARRMALLQCACRVTSPEQIAESPLPRELDAALIPKQLSDTETEALCEEVRRQHGRKIVCQPPGLPVLTLQPLPKEYAEALASTRGRTCKTCGTTPKNAGLCLVCGEIVCPLGACCIRDGVGECNRHAETCSGGVGVYLFLYVGSGIVFMPGHGGPWIAPCFLNAHGEEDPGLKRGDPLFLDESRYAQLPKLVATHDFDGKLPFLPTQGANRL